MVPDLKAKSIPKVEAKKRMLCNHCGSCKSPLWRRGMTSETLCNACGLYWKHHGRYKPRGLESSSKLSLSTTSSPLSLSVNGSTTDTTNTIAVDTFTNNTTTSANTTTSTTDATTMMMIIPTINTTTTTIPRTLHTPTLKSVTTLNGPFDIMARGNLNNSRAHNNSRQRSTTTRTKTTRAKTSSSTSSQQTTTRHLKTLVPAITLKSSQRRNRSSSLKTDKIALPKSSKPELVPVTSGGIRKRRISITSTTPALSSAGKVALSATGTTFWLKMADGRLRTEPIFPSQSLQRSTSPSFCLAPARVLSKEDSKKLVPPPQEDQSFIRYMMFKGDRMLLIGDHVAIHGDDETIYYAVVRDFWISKEEGSKRILLQWLLPKPHNIREIIEFPPEKLDPAYFTLGPVHLQSEPVEYIIDIFFSPQRLARPFTAEFLKEMKDMLKSDSQTERTSTPLSYSHSPSSISNKFPSIMEEVELAHLLCSMT